MRMEPRSSRADYDVTLPSNVNHRLIAEIGNEQLHILCMHFVSMRIRSIKMNRFPHFLASSDSREKKCPVKHPRSTSESSSLCYHSPIHLSPLATATSSPCPSRQLYYPPSTCLTHPFLVLHRTMLILYSAVFRPSHDSHNSYFFPA